MTTASGSSPLAPSPFVHAGAAAVVGAAAFIPLPLLDDIVASLSRRGLVGHILQRHGRTYGARELESLYGGGGGSLWGLPFRVLKALLLFPVQRVFRTVFFVFGLRTIALSVGETLALGHTLDRQLAAGRLGNDLDVATRRAQAARLRRALDSAYAGIDQRLVTRAVTAVMARARRIPAAQDDVQGFFADLDRRVDAALAA